MIEFVAGTRQRRLARAMAVPLAALVTLGVFVALPSGAAHRRPDARAEPVQVRIARDLVYVSLLAQRCSLHPMLTETAERLAMPVVHQLVGVLPPREIARLDAELRERVALALATDRGACARARQRIVDLSSSS